MGRRLRPGAVRLRPVDRADRRRPRPLVRPRPASSRARRRRRRPPVRTGAGGAAAALAADGVGLRLAVGDIDAVVTGDPVRTCARLLYGADFPPVTDVLRLTDGDVVDCGGGVDVRVIATPGHTPGSTSFVVQLPGGTVLLAGDALWGGFSTEIGSDLAAWRRSLERLADVTKRRSRDRERVGREVEADAGRLPRSEPEPPEPAQLSVRPDDRRDVVADVELHDLVAGTVAVVSHDARHPDATVRRYDV